MGCTTSSCKFYPVLQKYNIKLVLGILDIIEDDFHIIRMLRFCSHDTCQEVHLIMLMITHSELAGSYSREMDMYVRNVMFSFHQNVNLYSHSNDSIIKKRSLFTFL